MTDRLIRYAGALVLIAAGLAMALGYDRLGQRAEVLGLVLPLRIAAGLWQAAAGGLLLWPGRQGHGALMGLAAMGAALFAHLTVLGIDGAAPAVLLTLVMARLFWLHRPDLS
jgi:hypothetical protein